MAPNEPELRSWKEIAAYLGVSVRTAQLWEKERGLPVCRLGERGRVVAKVPEVEAWRTALLAEPGPVRAPRGRRGWIVAAVLVVALAGLATISLVNRGPATPGGVRVENGVLVVHDSQGRDLWRKPFPDGLGEYDSKALSRLAWIGDLDEDGHSELLFVQVPPSPTFEESGTPLICFSADGQTKWRFTPGKQIAAGGREFHPAYRIHQLVVFSPSADSRRKVAAVSLHIPEWPSQLALLDEKGALEAEYWHSGFLNEVLATDLDDDGILELISATTDNGHRRASLIVLDHRRMNGTSHSARPDYQLPGASGVEKALLYFPRTCVNRAMKPYNEAVALQATGQGLLVTTWEGAANFQGARVMYTLDRRLNVLRVDPDIEIQTLHRSLELKGLLDHTFAETEIATLQQGVTRVR